MAQEKVIVIVADTEKAQKAVKELTDNLSDMGKEGAESTEKVADNIEKTGKQSKKAKGGVKLLAGGFRALGTAIKATGIGLVVGLVTALGAALSKNQRFMDAFNTVTEAIGIVLGRVADALMDVYDSVSSNTENFNALGSVLKGIITLALTPFKTAFYGIKLGLQEAALIWEKSPFGSGDTKTINSLTKGIEETKDALKEVGTDAVDAGKQIITNFGEAVSETINIANVAGDRLAKVNTKNVLETAKNNVQLKNNAKLAAAEQSRLVEKYDRLAEKQRQIRDDESISIEDRKKANENLGKVLEQQEKAMLKQADLQIAAAQAEVNKNDTIENRVALTEALANREGVLAQVEGFRSEQLVNKIGLQKEEIELNNTISDAEKERRIAQLEFDAQQEETELAKLEKQAEALEVQKEQDLIELERKRNLYKEGTQARIDAEEEYKNRKQEIDNQLTENERKQAEEREKIETKVQETKDALVNKSFQLAGLLAKKGSGVAKGIAVARALQNTYQGITAELATKTATPFEFGLKLANIATVSAIGFKSVKDILKTKENSTSGGGGTSDGGGSGASAPSFNLVRGTDSNQIAESLQSNNDKPLEAFVVGSSVTTQQELDNNKIAIGTI